MEHSRLHKLPGELRNRIYRLALVQGDSFRLHPTETGIFVWHKSKNMAKEAYNLLSTCKQVRAEALPIFFAENHFEFET